MMLSAKASGGPVQQMRDVGGEKIVVLEKAQQAEIGRQTDHQRGFSRARRLASPEIQRAAV